MILTHESGSQEDQLDEKKWRQKISWDYPFKYILLSINCVCTASSHSYMVRKKYTLYEWKQTNKNSYKDFTVEYNTVYKNIFCPLVLKWFFWYDLNSFIKSPWIVILNTTFLQLLILCYFI